MWPTTQVNKIILLIQRDSFIRRNRRDDFCLILFSHVGKEFDRFITRHFRANHLHVALGNFIHALFNHRQIFGREWPLV